MSMSRMYITSFTRSRNSIGRTYSQWIGESMSQTSIPGNRYSQWIRWNTHSSGDYPHNL